MRVIRLLEHESLSVGDEAGCDLSLTQVAALQRAQPNHVSVLEWISHNKVKTTEQVGMIVAAGVRLEILPKVGVLDGTETRAILTRMIASVMNIPLHDGEVTGHNCQNRDLLEVLIGLFARRLEAQVRAGLSRAYRQRTDDLMSLRGKLNVTRQFTNLAATPQRLACTYDELTADTPLNRLLLCALTFLRRRSLRPDNQRLLSAIETHFENVTLSTSQQVLKERIVFARSDLRWSVLERLARSLLQGHYQTVHGSDRDGVALLFDMNVLFEKYVAHLSRSVAEECGYILCTQGPSGFLASDEAGRTYFHTRPDMHFRRADHVIVLDTKWKPLQPEQNNFGVLQADAYQMRGYASVYGAARVALVYPHPTGIPVAGMQRVWLFDDNCKHMNVVTVDLANPALFTSALKELLCMPGLAREAP